MKNHIYILGTGLSHDGSTCLLKDGKICVAIEKERLTRVKHDGINDAKTIEYCLKAEGIKIQDLALIVQNANFGKFKFGNDNFRGPRPFPRDLDIPIVTISHHLAHAYSTIGTCPFDKFNVLVMDGCGNSYDDCTDLLGASIPGKEEILQVPHLYNEKDSYYKFENNECTTLIKDFSEWGMGIKQYPMHPVTTKHSIGGLYAAVCIYCFGRMDDTGKLMGLAPYGRPGQFKHEIFELKDGRVFLNYDWMEHFCNPVRSFDDLKSNFQYYADIAYGVQKEIERAVQYIFRSRLNSHHSDNVCYAGGTALNAVANSKLLSNQIVNNLYLEPAAGDNGLALGCAFYGWIEVLKKERVKHNGSTCFGVNYEPSTIKDVLDQYILSNTPSETKKAIDLFFNLINECQNTQSHQCYANVQFNIENYGSYQVIISDTVTSGHQIIGRPTCLVNVNGDLFYRSLSSVSRLNDLLNAGLMTVSNQKDTELLTKAIDLNRVLQMLKVKVFDAAPGVNYVFTEDYINKAASLLARGSVLAWFQGGCEFGPRALGRRSILADPRLPNIRNFINSEIKLREDFRPFAPSVLAEDVGIYFTSAYESPYMILVDYVNEKWQEKIRSVIHEDRSSRVQTVRPDWNPRYYELLIEFRKQTGISLLLNTSLNRKGMPIVETPAEALDFFFSSKIDYLIIDKFIVSK